MGRIATNTVIQDGVQYLPGQEIPDLGSWEVVAAKGMMKDYEGLSRDLDKLPHYVDTGSSAFCVDTSEVYEFHKPTDKWYKL